MSKKEKINSGFFDYLRFGESYTSLLLGIVVVIISTVLLLSFVHNKNVGTKTTPNNQQSKTVVKATAAPSVTSSATSVPTKAASSTPTENNESSKIVKVTNSVVKNVSLTVKPTVVSTKSPTHLETKVESKGTYTVKKGDTLWKIAEKEYKSGYNWVDIASVNKLNNPNAIHAGNKLVLPKVKSKAATATVTKVTPTPTVAKAKATPTPQAQKDKKVDQKVQPQMQKIIGAEYKVVKGDNLWNIAIRAYGDGYQWVKISQANKLANPDLIYPDTKLTIPRGK